MRFSRLPAYVALALAMASPAAPAHAGPAADGVTLKSGTFLRGRVVEETPAQGGVLLRIETDFGTLTVPRSEVASMPAPQPAPDTAATYVARTIRVVKLQGRVERKAKGAVEWQPVAFVDAYGKRRGHDELLLPGDSVRTGPDGAVDFMFHKDAWGRLAQDSEITLPEAGAGASLHLLRGATAVQVERRPAGATFRVQTPSAVLGVKGTTFAVQAAEGSETLDVLHGTVTVDQRGDVAAGESAAWTAAGTVDRKPMSFQARRQLERPFLRLPADDMVLVPAGAYPLGGVDPLARAGPRPPTGPVRKPTSRDLPAYWIDRCEVSRDDVLLYRTATGTGLAHALARDVATGSDTLPACYLSLAEAEAFAAWCGREVAGELAWEAAARGPRGNVFPWGSSPLGDSARVHRGVYRSEDAGLLSSTDSLGAVVGPTDDVSPFGCLQFASNAPESAEPSCWTGRRLLPQRASAAVAIISRAGSTLSPTQATRRPSGASGVGSAHSAS